MAKVFNMVGGGVNTNDATATAADVAAGLTFYAGGEKKTGTVKEIVSGESAAIAGVPSDRSTSVAGTTYVSSIRMTGTVSEDTLLRKGSEFSVSATFKSGDIDEFGDAARSDVASGVTFTSAAVGVKHSGTLSQPGSAIMSVSGYIVEESSLTLLGQISKDMILRKGDSVRINSAPVENFGTALPEDVLEGKLFSSEAGFAIRGNRPASWAGELTFSGTYASSTYYTKSGCSLAVDIDKGMAFLTIQGGTSTTYENIYFQDSTTYMKLPEGVDFLPTQLYGGPTGGSASRYFTAVFTGITGKINVNVALSSRSSDYDYVRATVTMEYVTKKITADNIGEHFTVENGEYYFAGEGGTFTSNNAGVDESNAMTTLTALYDMEVGFDYAVSSEGSYDKFYYTEPDGGTLYFSGEESGRVDGIIVKAGDTLILSYEKDGSAESGSDQAVVSNITCTPIETAEEEVTA